MTTSSLPVVADRPMENINFRSKAIFKYRKTWKNRKEETNIDIHAINKLIWLEIEFDCKILPFDPMGNQECKLCVEIQRQRMIVQDVDVAQFELQMQCCK